MRVRAYRWRIVLALSRDRAHLRGLQPTEPLVVDMSPGQPNLFAMAQGSHGVSETPLADRRKSAFLSRAVKAGQQLGRAQGGPFLNLRVKVQEPSQVGPDVFRSRGKDKPGSFASAGGRLDGRW